MNAYSNVFNVLAQNKKFVDDNYNIANDLISRVDKQYQKMSIYSYRPDENLVTDMQVQINSDNNKKFAGRTKNVYYVLDQFDTKNNSELQKVLKDVSNLRYTTNELSSSNVVLFNSLIKKIKANQKDAKGACEELIQNLYKLRTNIDRATHMVLGHALNFCVTAVVDPAGNTNSVPSYASQENSMNKKSVKKMNKNGEIVIETPVKDSKGNYYIRQNGVDGKLKAQNKK